MFLYRNKYKMPSVSGNLKSDKLTIQGHGTLAADVVMSVESDTFLMKMGGDVLMAVSPEGASEINDGGSGASTLTLNRNTVIAGDLNVTGVSTAVTQAAGNNTTRVATTAFVRGEVAALVGGASGAYDTLQEIQNMLMTDASGITSVVNTLAAKAPLASPALTGVPTAPTAAAGVNTTQLATTSFVHTEIANLVDGATGAYDTLKEIQDLLVADASGATAMLSAIEAKANAADVTSSLALKAPLASPALTGVPVAPTAVSGTDTTQIATTAFVASSLNTFKNVVDALAGKTYCLYMIDTMVMNTGTDIGPLGMAITMRFNKDQTFTLISCSQNFNADQFTVPEAVFPYTIVSEPTESVGAVISFITTDGGGRGYGFLPYYRLSNITFDLNYVKIVNFLETLESFTLKTTADTITNAIVTPTSESDFLTKFLAAYTANNGNSLYQVDASGNYTADISGNRVNIGSVYTSAGVDWKKQVAIRLMSTNSDLVLTENILSRLQLATKFYENELMVGYSDVSTGYCGIKLDVEYDTLCIPQQDIYNIPISIHNAGKRLTGVSDSKFEPDLSTFLGKNCADYEIVNASDSLPARIKHITVRGLDVIAHNHRMHFDLSKMNYLKGRSLSYCRHKESLLNDTYWYPNGPEFRINLNPEFTITKMLVNDVQIPSHLIKRKHWDNYIKDSRAVTFNIAKAIEETGVTFKYDTDASGNYVEADLNKVEIWYQGKYNKDNGALPADIVSVPFHVMVPSSKTDDMSVVMNNPKMYDQCKTIGAKYGVSTQVPENNVQAKLSSDGFFTLQDSLNKIQMVVSTMISSSMNYYPNDPAEFHMFLFVPSNDNAYDKFYHQIEIMCPKPFVASTGGTHLESIESADKNSLLYRFVPGAKADGDDYRSTYSTALSFRVKGFPVLNETITVHDSSNNLKVIPYYAEIPAEMKPYYNLPTTLYNATNTTNIMQSIEKIMGPYPFDTFGLGIANSRWGAMEHMEMATYGPSQMSAITIIHENFHMWWQNTVSFEHNKDWWIDEGLNDFSMWWVADDLNLDPSGNLFYTNQVINKVHEVENGWGIDPLSAYTTGSYGSYSHPSYIYATMYYNMGADFKVDSSENFVVKPVDASGNIAMNILDASGAVVSSGLLNPVSRQLIVDTSGTLRYVSPSDEVTDASGVVVNNQSVEYMLGYVNSSGALFDSNGSAIVVVEQTLTSGLKLPSGPLTSYYAKNSSNTNFWNCMKFMLNRFKGSNYNFEKFKTAIGDFVEANKASWDNKWPSTRGEIVELFDQMVNKGGNKPLGGNFYTITIDPAYVPAGVVTNPTPVVSKLTIDGVVYEFAYCYTPFATSNSLVDITLPLAHLQDASGKALLGYPDDFAGKDFTGKILLIKRGVLTFAYKIYYAQLFGAAGVLIYNNAPSLNTAFLGSSPFKLRVPCATISGANGTTITSLLAANPGLTARIQGKFALNL